MPVINIPLWALELTRRVFRCHTTVHLLVCYHADWCTKNKHMIRTPTHGLFLPWTESPFLLSTHNIKNKSGCVLLIRKKSFTWKGIPLFMVENSHPLRSLAWSQLPLCPLHSSHPRTRFPPKRKFICTQMTLTCPLLLSGTILVPIKAYMINLILLVSAL
jgi:hypothetical protein